MKSLELLRRFAAYVAVFGLLATTMMALVAKTFEDVILLLFFWFGFYWLSLVLLSKKRWEGDGNGEEVR